MQLTNDVNEQVGDIKTKLTSLAKKWEDVDLYYSKVAF